MALIAAAAAFGALLLAAPLAGRRRWLAMALTVLAGAALILALASPLDVLWPRFDPAGAVVALTAAVIAIASAATGRRGPILVAAAAILTAGWPMAEAAWALGVVAACLAPTHAHRRGGALLALSAGLAGLAFGAAPVVVAGLVVAALLAGREAGAVGMLAAGLALSRLAPEGLGLAPALGAMLSLTVFGLLDRRAGVAGAPAGLGLAGLLSGDPAAASAGWLMLAADAIARASTALAVRARPFLRALTRAAAAGAPPAAGFVAGVALLFAFADDPTLLAVAALCWGLSLALALRAPALRRVDGRVLRHPAAVLLALAAAFAAFPPPAWRAMLAGAGP